MGFDEVDLQATSFSQPFSTSAYEGLKLDSISVERHAVPEPGSLALLGLAGLLAAASWARARTDDRSAGDDVQVRRGPLSSQPGPPVSSAWR